MSPKYASIIGVTLLVTLGVLGILPAINVSASTGGCVVNWNDPTGSYSPGSTVSASVSTTNCAQGSGTWQVCDYPIVTTQLAAELQCAQAVSPNSNIVQSGTFSCTAAGVCTANPLFTDTASSTSGVSCSSGTACTLGPATYEYVGTFAGSSTQHAFTSSVAVVTPEFPAGGILAILAPIGALIGYAKFGRSAIRKPI